MSSERDSRGHRPIRVKRGPAGLLNGRNCEITIPSEVLTFYAQVHNPATDGLTTYGILEADDEEN